MKNQIECRTVPVPCTPFYLLFSFLRILICLSWIDWQNAKFELVILILWTKSIKLAGKLWYLEILFYIGRHNFKSKS